jgi:hypothetical protein
MESNMGNENDMQQHRDILVFDNFDNFSRSVEGLGFDLDFPAIIELDIDFIQATDKYLLLNIKEYGVSEPNNILILTDEKSYVYSKGFPQLRAVQAFEDILAKPYGRGTILCFLTLNKVLDNHKTKLETMIKNIRSLELKFSIDEYRRLALEFDRLSDRLDEFHDLLIRLQERHYRQIQSQYISFDYNVLLAESTSLQRRCRRRLNTLKELRQDHEMKGTEDLNQKIMNLNNIVKKLTALTVIFMIPTMISSHFGMNFNWMPELTLNWVYPVVIAVQVILLMAGLLIFKKLKWL